MKRVFFATFSRLLRDIYGTSFHTHTHSSVGTSRTPENLQSPLSAILHHSLRSCHLAPGESASQLVSASKNVLLVLPRCFPSDFAPVKRAVSPGVRRDTCVQHPDLVQTQTGPRPRSNRALHGKRYANRCSRIGEKHLSHVVPVHHFLWELCKCKIKCVGVFESVCVCVFIVETRCRQK